MAWNNVLAYVKGGAAVVNDKYDVIFAGAVADTAKGTRWGGTVGAGLEFGFAPNWSVGVEYDHIFLDSHDTTLTAVPGGGAAGTFTFARTSTWASCACELSLRRPVIAKY